MYYQNSFIVNVGLLSLYIRNYRYKHHLHSYSLLNKNHQVSLWLYILPFFPYTACHTLVLALQKSCAVIPNISAFILTNISLVTKKHFPYPPAVPYKALIFYYHYLNHPSFLVFVHCCN